MDLKKIGQIQIAIGIIFLLITIGGTIFFWNYLVGGSEYLSGSLSSITENRTQLLSEPVTYQMGIVDIAISLRFIVPILVSCPLILLLLSLVMILQGLANVKRI